MSMPVHSHDHGGHHHGGAPDYGPRFAIGVVLNLAFVIVEASVGLVTGSLALVADAGHNLSDVASLLLAWGAVWLAGRRPTMRTTYGLRKATVLASLASACLLLIALGVITWEAVGRLQEPTAVGSTQIILVAAIGVVINVATALLFFAGRKDDLNIRGAYLHMAADAAVSLGVVVGGIVIGATGWGWVDPVLSLLIVVVILIGTWGLLRESTHLLLDGVPAGLDPRAVQEWLLAHPDVASVHDLHIWGLSTTEVALTAHLVTPAGYPGTGVLQELTAGLHDRFGIDHATLQIEVDDPGHGCALER
ncbi:cation diffusion facilitator family transporter [bacterium]|nr:cation diffusion facilitator family transporter [bacterium]